jgi:hypothetical protein
MLASPEWMYVKVGVTSKKEKIYLSYGKIRNKILVCVKLDKIVTCFMVQEWLINFVTRITQDNHDNKDSSDIKFYFSRNTGY